LLAHSDAGEEVSMQPERQICPRSWLSSETDEHAAFRAHAAAAIRLALPDNQHRCMHQLLVRISSPARQIVWQLQ
jgi:hypothetical protein